MSKKDNKTGWMVFYKGEIHGVIFDKKEFKTFKKQRNMDLYDVLEKPVKEIESLMAYRGISQYHTKSRDHDDRFGDILLFDHEELYVLETVDEEVVAAIEIIRDTFSMFQHYFKFTNEESLIIQGTLVVAFEILKRAEMDYSGIRIDRIADTWLELMNLSD